MNEFFRLFVLIALVASAAAQCNPGFFQCKDQSKCIEQAKVCNFEDDCTDKSDEAMCGTCDFETSMCGYYEDDQNGRFRWSRIQGPSVNPNPGEGPTTDHTYINNPTTKGYFMSTQSTTNTSIRSYLWGPTMSRLSDTCKIKMWIYMKNNSSRISFYYSNASYVYNYKFLKSIYGDGQPTWKMETLDVGISPAGFRLEINAYPYYAFGSATNYSDIALDDIEWLDCSAKQTIELDKSLNCNFDTDFCFYKNDIDATIMWTRKANSSYSSTGPPYDHTTGYGYYAYMTVTYSVTGGKPARLISSIQTQRSNQDFCFDFWYLMFGETVNRLSLYIDEFDSNNQGYTVYNRTQIWTRQKTQGRKWLNYKANINSNKQWRVVLEALSGTTSISDIAIDDLVLNGGKCPPSKACDFEAGLCEFQNVNDQTAELQWVAGKPYPYSVDHTTSTNASQFAYVSGASTAPNSKGRLESIKYPASGVECAQFWYMFETNDRIQAMELNVYQKVGTNYGSAKWTKQSMDDDRAWSYGQIEIDPTSGDYTIVFEALKRTNLANAPLIVGLDDVIIVPGQCKSAINTGFEDQYFGSWKQSEQNNINWLLNRGKTDSLNTGPHVDVTLGTDEGYYVYIETSSPTKPGDKAILVSEFIDPVAQGASSCFAMWYFMFGGDVGELSVWLNDTVTGMRVLTNITGQQGFYWFPLYLSIDNPNEFRIAIRGVAGKSFEGDIAIDELSYTTMPCPAYTTPYVSTIPFDNKIECNFDSNTICDWTNDPTSTYSWALQNGPTPTALTGPPNDHTKNSGAGYYIYMSSASPRKRNETARIASYLLDAGSVSGGGCFSFYYFMFGPDVGRLNVYHEFTQTATLSGSYGKPVLTRFGNHGNQWRHAQVFMPGSPVDKLRIILEGVIGKGQYGDIAVDDVMFHIGECPYNNFCDFETPDLCGYTIADPDRGLGWEREQSTDDQAPDHTLGHSLGHYMVANSYSPHIQGRSARLFTHQYTEQNICVRFWYKLIGDVEFNIRTLSAGNFLSPPYFTAKVQRGYDWSFGQVTIDSMEAYQIVFETVDPGIELEGQLILDDVYINVNKKCDPLAYCDFENGDMCGYHHNTRFSDFNWVMLSGDLGSSQNDWDVPKVDNTLGTAKGSFLYLHMTQNRNERERSIIESEIVPEKLGVLCFQFFLSVNDFNTAALVMARKDVNFPANTSVFFHTNRSEGAGWRSHKIELENLDYPYTILIEGAIGRGNQDPNRKGHMAIDDIMLMYGKCDSAVLSTTKKGESSSSNIGLIIGILIPVAFLVALIGYGLFFVYRKNGFKSFKFMKFGNGDDLNAVNPSYSVNNSGE